MNEEEVKQRIYELIDTCNKGIGMHPYDADLFETDKKALKTVLNLLEQKDNKINKVIDKAKKDIKANEYTEFAIRGNLDFRNNGKLVEAREILKILEL